MNVWIHFITKAVEARVRRSTAVKQNPKDPIHVKIKNELKKMGYDNKLIDKVMSHNPETIEDAMDVIKCSQENDDAEDEFEESNTFKASTDVARSANMGESLVSFGVPASLDKDAN